MLKVIHCFDNSQTFQQWVGQDAIRRTFPVFTLTNPPVLLNEEDRAQFLKAYVDLIGRLSVENHSLLWWATDISSKNRFFSPLIPFLEKFFKLMQVVEHSDVEILVCVDMPLEIYAGVKQNLNLKGIDCFWKGNLTGVLWNVVKAPIGRIAGILRHIGCIIPRMQAAGRLFKPVIAQAMQDDTPVYVIKTFVSQKSFDAHGKYKDLFFSSLTDFISTRKRTVILADITDDFSNTVQLIHQKANGYIYPLEAFLSWGDILKASWLMLVYGIRIPRVLLFGPYDIEPLMRCICLTQGVKIQPLQLYHYFAMVHFLKAFKVADFLLTSEYNPWEKMCLWAIQQYAPDVQTYGYQHTVVPQASVNMFTSRLEQDFIPRPKRLLTVGQKPKDIIHRYETCASSSIEAACGLRFEHLFGQPQHPRGHRGHILLALEGLPQVAQVMDYVLKELIPHQKYRLKIRAHPLPMNQFTDRVSIDLRPMASKVISKGTTLKEDLLWADIVVYWGSTVALEAVSMGIPIIHYDIGSILSYDPLFELKQFKWIVGKPGELKVAIDAIYALSEGDYSNRCRIAQEYISGYFHKITPQAMSLFEE